MNDLARLLDAIAFASERHRDQRRKDAAATPYINHPLSLARMLAVEGGVADIEVLMAAVLHDTVEDTATTVPELEARFGRRVAGIVDEVSDDRSLSKERRKQVQIDHAPHLSIEAALVKLADKSCNLRDVADAPPADWTLERRREYFDWAKRVTDRLPIDAAGMRSVFDRAYSGRP